MRERLAKSLLQDVVGRSCESEEARAVDDWRQGGSGEGSIEQFVRSEGCGRGLVKEEETS